MGHAGIALDGVRPEQEDYGTIEAWRNRPIEGEHPYVYLDGIVLKRSWAGEVRNVSLLVAIAVNGEGYREILEKLRALRLNRAADLVERRSRRRSPTTPSLRSTGGASAPTIFFVGRGCIHAGGGEDGTSRSGSGKDQDLGKILKDCVPSPSCSLWAFISACSRRNQLHMRVQQCLRADGPHQSLGLLFCVLAVGAGLVEVVGVLVAGRAVVATK